MNGPFKRVVSITLAGTVSLHCFEHEPLPPEKADPARNHVPGEPIPADPVINLSVVASTATGTGAETPAVSYNAKTE